MSLTRENADNVIVNLKVSPTLEIPNLPPNLKLILLTEREVFKEVTSRQTSIFSMSLKRGDEWRSSRLWMMRKSPRILWCNKMINKSNLIISTQVINEILVNLIKKAKFDETQIKAVIQSLYNCFQVGEFDLTILEFASNLRRQCNFSFWDSLIVATALAGGADTLYSEDMQDGLIVSGQLTLINPFK